MTPTTTQAAATRPAVHPFGWYLIYLGGLTLARLAALALDRL